MGNTHAEERKLSKPKTPTFLLELPLVADAGQAARMGAHLEVGRMFYNAMLSAGQHRLRRMRADPAWQAARAIPRTQKQERKAAFAALRERYGFSEYACARAGTDTRYPRLPRPPSCLPGQGPPRAL
jgi:hypothetical protein